MFAGDSDGSLCPRDLDTVVALHDIDKNGQQPNHHENTDDKIAERVKIGVQRRD